MLNLASLKPVPSVLLVSEGKANLSTVVAAVPVLPPPKYPATAARTRETPAALKIPNAERVITYTLVALPIMR